MAYAASEGASGGQGGVPGLGNYSFIILMVLTVAIFYFLLIRPQKKREKDRVGMISSLKQGDKVVTAGGMYGIIDSFKEGDIVVLKISGNTKVEFNKSAIQSKVS
ncbi:MAG: preprotein translocase subunit YajC [Spirochaetes bacterium RBG_13_51_14]|nr:MAG: preprotein translocase subunit YajC [Spirochaetes bacterium RBG_13_51_14]